MDNEYTSTQPSWVDNFNERLTARNGDPDLNVGGYRNRDSKGKGSQADRIRQGRTEMSDHTVRACKTSRQPGRG